jgi:rRNA maturation RNase YbeY
METPIINFHNEDTSFNINNEPALTSWLCFCAENEGFSIGEINYIFCSDEYLHKMNVEYLNHDTYTDIITFDYSEEKLISGDMFISIERVAENASIFATDLESELHRVIIHGLLHLCGYKDKTSDDQSIMRKKEDYCLNLRKF